MIGSTVITSPLVSSGPSHATFGTSGSSWIAAADAVAGQLGADAEAAALDLGLHGAADRAHVVAGGSGLEAAPQRGLGGGGEPLLARLARVPDRHGAAGVGVEAVELGGDVELDQLALAQPAGAGDAVDALVVDGDADGPGEVVVQLRAGARAVAGEDGEGDLVELGGGHAGTDAARHLTDRLRDDAAGGAQGGQLIRVIDGHPVILTHLMSSATFSRPSRGDVLELTIDSLAHGGNGVARREGYVVFVAGGIPGDKVRAVVGKAKKAYAEARAIEIVEPSPDRVPEVADHPGAPWQVIPYERQLAVKAEQVDDALRRIGRLDGFEMEPIVPAVSSGATATRSSTRSGRRDGRRARVRLPRARALERHRCR